VVGDKPRHQLQNRFQIVDVGRVASACQIAVVAQEGSDLPGEIRTDEPDAGAIEAGVADRKLVCRGPPPPSPRATPGCASAAP